MSGRPSLLAGLVVSTPDGDHRWYPCGGERSSVDGDWRDAAQPAMDRAASHRARASWTTWLPVELELAPHTFDRGELGSR